MASIQSTTNITNIYELIDNLDVKGKEVSVELGSKTNSADTSTIKNVLKKDGESITDVFDYSQKIKDKMKASHISKQEPYMEIAQNLKKTIQDIIDSVTEDDIKSIINSNYNPEKISLHMFKKMIDYNKEAVKTEDYEKLEEDVNEQVKAFKEQFSDNDTLKQIITNLKKYNMPVNLKNINKIYQVLNKVDAIKELSNSSIVNLIKQNKELTLENIYKAKFTSTTNENGDDLKELEANIKELLKKADLPITKDMINLSKLLIKKDIPLDENTYYKVKVLRERIKFTNKEQIIQKAVENYSKKKGITDIQIIGSEVVVSENSGINQAKELEQTINQLSNVNIQHIKDVVKSNQVINIKNLILAVGVDYDNNLTQETQQVINGLGEATVEASYSQPDETNPESSKELKVIKANLNLEEIRLKMTLEIATRLKNQGISIEIEPLQKVVNELRSFERQTYAKHLEQSIVPATQEKIDQMQNVFEQVHQMGNASSKVILKVASKEIDFTIKSLSNASRQELLTANALKDYDTLSTKPRRDLGDTIQKAFVNLDKQLEQIGVEATDVNLRAAKVLAKNELPLTPVGIDAIKMVDQKVLFITENLNPSTVAQMIKEQLSPVDMHIDSVISYMNQFNQKMGYTIDNNFSKAIYLMESDKSITNEERESVIGIYRMLNTVSKSKGEAVGFLMKNNMPLKLDNLFEAAKYIKKTTSRESLIQADINDDFGMLQEIKYHGKSIKQQIKTALKNTTLAQTKENVRLVEALEKQGSSLSNETINKAGFNSHLLNNLINKAIPDKVIALAKNGGLNNLSTEVDTLLQQLSEIGIDEVGISNFEEIYDSIKSLSKLNTEALLNIEKYGMTKNLDTIATANKLIDNPFELSYQLKNIIGRLDDQSIDTTELKEMLEKMEVNDRNYDDTIIGLKEKLNSLRERLLDTQHKDINLSLKTISNTNEMLDYQKAIHKQDEYYQIPLMINGKLTQLNMYYFNNKNQGNNQNGQEQLNVYMYFNTENMGKVQAHMNIEGDTMDFSINSSQPEDLELIKAFGDRVKELLNNTKYNIENINYGYFEGKSPIQEEIKEVPDSGKLYHSDSVFETII